MSDVRQNFGSRPALRRMAGRAVMVVVSSVVLVAFGATAAAAAPAPVTPAPTGTITTNSNGSVTITATGTWSWTVGSANGDVDATTAHPCGSDFGVGWGMVWDDPADPGYALSYAHGGTSYSADVSSPAIATPATTADETVGYNATTPCGTFSTGAPAVTGQWTATHTYASAAAVPTSICVVTYTLKNSSGSGPQYLVDKNKHNSFRTAVTAGDGATFASSAACFDPATFKATPTIVTTATNAQVGSAVTDEATLGGTAATGAGGSVTFNLYGASDTTCSSTPIYTSPAYPVTGNGTYGPATYTPTQGPGTYQWIATYSGDAGNNGATEVCAALGEASTVSATTVTTTNPSTGSSSSTPVVTTATTQTTPVTTTAATAASTTSTATTPIAGATTVHTGEPWAGSRPYVVAVVAFGFSLMGLGFFERRRMAVRKQAQDSALSTD